MQTKKFSVSGMSCAACSAHVTKAVSKVDGVKEVNVNLLSNSMTVSYDESKATPDGICAAVKAAGYGASYTPDKKEKSAAGDRAMFVRFAVSLCILVPLMYISMGHMAGLPQPFKSPLAMAIAQAVLAAAILIINNAYFIKGAKALFHGAPNMDTLVSLGAAASFVYGVYNTVLIAGGNTELVHHLYYESAAMIPTLISLGRYLEARSKKKTQSALASLAELMPKTATLYENGQTREILTEQIKPGDILEVKNGASFAVDGVIISGECSADESDITGESMPVFKKEGDRVTGATVCTSGYVLMRAEKVGDDTLMAQIISLVESASASKAPVGRLADKISGIFVPCVIAVSLITAAAWLISGGTAEQALRAGISVLVISCPCSLGLATPVAIMAGTGKSAKEGMLIKEAAALEQLCSVDCVVFDKTGTLTTGSLTVSDVSSSRADFLQILASVEAKSEHAIAKAITNCEETVWETENFKTFSGQGVYAELNGNKYYAGNIKFLSGNGTDVSAAQKDFEKYSTQGKTPVFLAENGVYIGCAAVSDTVREGAAECVKALKSAGKEVYMLTGDNAVTARAVANALGIENVTAGVLPTEKQSAVLSLTDAGKKVAFVGDGVNDAPALTGADVGIAMRSGTEIAIESADIVLVHKDLRCLTNGIAVSEKTMRIIKQNLFWAFFYNTVSIPIAAFGLLSPMIAAAAMSLSSLTVVTNSLRLFWGKKAVKTESEGEINMTKTLKIDGMMCMHCAGHVKGALLGVDGVTGAEVNLEAKTATVKLGKAVADEVLAKAVSEAGYTVVSVE